MAPDTSLSFEPIAGPPGTAWHVTLESEALAWRPAANPDAKAQRRPLADICSVTLAVLPRPGSPGPLGSCVVGFVDQTEFVALSADDRDAPNERGAQAYASFVDALHARLATRDRIRFLAGMPTGGASGRALLLAALLVLAFLALGWMSDGPWWSSMIILLAAALAAKVLLRRPPQAEYDPRAIPPALRIG